MVQLKKSSAGTVTGPTDPILPNWDDLINFLNEGNFTPKSVVFVDSNSELTEDSSNFVWDYNNQRLGLGTTLPGYLLDVSGTGRIDTLSSGSATIGGSGIDTPLQITSTDDIAQISIADNDTTGYIVAKDSYLWMGLNSGGSASNIKVDSSGFITVPADPTNSYHVATKSYVDTAAGGADWQNSVIDEIDLTTSEPGSPSDGDRYINTATGTSSGTSQSVTANYIYEWSDDSGDWVETAANEGMATWVEDIDVQKVFNGSTWVTIGSTSTHNNLSGLQGGTTDEYYHLTATTYGYIDQDVGEGADPWFGDLTLVDTDAGSSVGPVLNLWRNSTTPADDDDIGVIYFQGQNSAGETIDYARIWAEITDYTDATEDGKLYIGVMQSGSLYNNLYMDTQTVYIGNEMEIVSAGGATDVGLYFNGDDNTGLYSPGLNKLGVSAGGTLILNVTTSGIDVTGNIVTSGRIGNLDSVSDIGQQLEAGDATNTTLRFDSDNWRLYAGGASGGGVLLQVTETGVATFSGNLNADSGLDVTGNITVTGTVDGVDIASLSSSFNDHSARHEDGGADEISIDGLLGAIGTAAQPNITSVGTLTGLTVSGATTVNNVLKVDRIVQDPDPDGDHTVGVGSTVWEDETAGESLVFGDLVYFKVSDGKWWKADCDAAASSTGLIGLWLETTAADATGDVLLEGTAEDASWTWTTTGSSLPLYISATGGSMTETAPAITGQIGRVVAHNLSATIIRFKPDNTWAVV